MSTLHLKFKLIYHIDHLQSFVLIKHCLFGQLHAELLSSAVAFQQNIELLTSHFVSFETLLTRFCFLIFVNLIFFFFHLCDSIEVCEEGKTTRFYGLSKSKRNRIILKALHLFHCSFKVINRAINMFLI